MSEAVKRNIHIEMQGLTDAQRVVFLTSILKQFDVSKDRDFNDFIKESQERYLATARLAVAESQLTELREQVESRQATIEAHEQLWADREPEQASEREQWLRARLEAASRKLEDVEEINSHAATQADELRTRAQRAESELATLKPKLQRALAELATERKRAETLEAEVETSEAEFTALKEGPCDASA